MRYWIIGLLKVQISQNITVRVWQDILQMMGFWTCTRTRQKWLKQDLSVREELEGGGVSHMAFQTCTLYWYFTHVQYFFFCHIQFFLKLDYTTEPQIGALHANGDTVLGQPTANQSVASAPSQYSNGNVRKADRSTVITHTYIHSDSGSDS